MLLLILFLHVSIIDIYLLPTKTDKHLALDSYIYFFLYWLPLHTEIICLNFYILLSHFLICTLLRFWYYRHKTQSFSFFSSYTLPSIPLLSKT